MLFRSTVKTVFGEISAHAVEPLKAGDAVALSVRPEDLVLDEARPAGAPNLLEGLVQAREFLGECVNIEIRVGEERLLARAHPSQRTGIGKPIFVSLPAEKCLALSRG